MWHSFGDAEAYRTKNDILLGHCADVGRDPAEIERTWGVRSEIVEEADALVGAGVQHLILGVGGDGHGYDLGALRELAAWRDARGDA
jgi:hypothetical protein